MSEVHTWSSTAGDNDAASPNGFAEGMAPGGLNNSAREVMAALKRGVIIWFDSVTTMRAVDVEPETVSRYALLSTTPGEYVRFYQWLDTKTGSDNGTTIISPTSFSAGAFEEIGRRLYSYTAIAGLVAGASVLAGSVTVTP